MFPDPGSFGVAHSYFTRVNHDLEDKSPRVNPTSSLPTSPLASGMILQVCFIESPTTKHIQSTTSKHIQSLENTWGTDGKDEAFTNERRGATFRRWHPPQREVRPLPTVEEGEAPWSETVRGSGQKYSFNVGLTMISMFDMGIIWLHHMSLCLLSID